MTWYLDADTGDLYDPSGGKRATLDGPPYTLPNDAQAWAATEFRAMQMSDLTTDKLADFAELWVGDIEFGGPPKPPSSLKRLK
jgi:hypothetical protein